MYNCRFWQAVSHSNLFAQRLRLDASCTQLTDSIRLCKPTSHFIHRLGTNTQFIQRFTVPFFHRTYPTPLVTNSPMAQTGETDVPLLVVYITVPNKETATNLATSLVSNKLAACVNQVPGVVSTYMWEGKVETDEEILLVVKTRKSLLEGLMAHVKEHHPYKVPEVIAIPIVGGSDSYIKWVMESTLAPVIKESIPKSKD